ncbi:MFS transporter [Nannocystis bainbridge]|uniref:MFS transporter n=1 Tax=Nannocystis bainbridge TaxID=2995303 RepID=A0ABT5E278_9BACT|nr:MFS transporter [Nannocystis bainbridge]MDC0719984.1 MFS transporter [Nannocystis bainbridge]
MAETLWILAAVYFVVMMIAARSLARPPDGWCPDGHVPKAIQAGGEPELTMPMAVRTRQFWLLWGMLFINISAGISILAQASPMMQDLFQRTPEQAAAMVSVIAGFNAFGRIFWASLSDRIGRRAVFSIFFAAQAGLFLAIPQLAASGQWQLFQLAVVVIFTMYGGGFATIPAFLADMFGARNVGAVHGVILTAWSAAGVAGPILITSIREARLQALPPGGARVELYASTLQIMAAALLVGLALTLAVRPLARGR